jgi:hypothetical protein
MTARSKRSQPRRWPLLRGCRVWLACLPLAAGQIHAAPADPVPDGLARQSPPICRAEASGPEPIVRGFLGYPCRDARCGSHKAGFDWAERNGIADVRACQARNDVAFTEGCRVYANETVTPEQAGFQWARENELRDPCLCPGAGPGFEAGCEAWVTGFAD